MTMSNRALDGLNTDQVIMSKQALAGVKVLDFSWWAAGPMATKVLADLGALVIKVENREHIDHLRVSEPYKGEVADIDKSGAFLQLNTGKLSLGLDVMKPKGLAIAKELVKWADVVVENFAVGVMERMSLGYDELKRLNEDIIFFRSSSLGQNNVYKKSRGAGHVAGGLAGNYFLTGWPDRTPSHSVSIAWCDIVQSIMGTVAVLAALDYRRRTGKGLEIDSTQLEANVHVLAPAFLDYQVNKRIAVRNGNRDASASPHGAFPCKGDDQWCAIAVFTQEEWERLCSTMGKPELIVDTRFSSLEARKAHEDELEEIVSGWTVRFAPHELMAKLQKAGVRSGVVQTAADIVGSDPQVQAREFFLKLEHPAMGVVNHPSSPFKFSKTPIQVKTAPLFGEHDCFVCTQILGMSGEEFAALVNEGVVM